ncbi:phosphoglycerate mutase-like protein [Thozetella sp. PMI_491]|nr:phosphoglycerate mutase-like protein [Thozetella sp. PMI_491]
MSLRLSTAWVFLGLGCLASAYPSGDANDFNIYEHLGNLSPYFVPSNTPESLKSGAPPTCTVDKAFLVHRHGSRSPLSDEVQVIQNLSSYISDNRALFSSPQTTVPGEFAFLVAKSWASTFVTNDLSPIGRQQLFDHGVALRLGYPQLYTDQALVGNQDRVVESAVWFMDGYYGRSANTSATRNLIKEDEQTVSWITPMDTCDSWSYSYGGSAVAAWGTVYLPPIMKRINGLLAEVFPGVNFTATHVHGMLYACAYGTAVYGKDSSPWCPIFLPQEILMHEYEYDLLMRNAFGYGLPGNMGPVLGSMLVANLTDFMLQSAQNLSLNFGHDTTIDMGLAALGLAFDDKYLVGGPVDPNRSWRTARQVPFAAQMLWRGLSCGCGKKRTKRIQLLLNEANFDLSPVGCKSDAYGTCGLTDFLAADRVQAARNTTFGDVNWATACAA